MENQKKEVKAGRVLENNFAEFLSWYDKTRSESEKNYQTWKSSDAAKEHSDVTFHQYLVNLFLQTPQGGSFKKSLLGCMIQELGEHKLIGLNQEKQLIEIPLKLLEAKTEEKPS